MFDFVDDNQGQSSAQVGKLLPPVGKPVTRAVRFLFEQLLEFFTLWRRLEQRCACASQNFAEGS